LYGIPKVLLRNSVPIDGSSDLVDDYEITPEFGYQKKNDGIEVIKKPWQIIDDEGVPSYSLMAQPVAVSLIKQMAEVLGL